MEPNNLPDPDTLSYEQAKQELQRIVTQLETGNAPLEQALGLWQRGQQLAARCTSILNAATAQVEAAQGGEAAEAVLEEQVGKGQ